jgi:hypothetical protein
MGLVSLHVLREIPRGVWGAAMWFASRGEGGRVHFASEEPIGLGGVGSETSP